MALVSYVCFLRVAEAASVRVGDVRDSSYLVFWNSKTGHEGWKRRPVPPWVRPFVEWLHDWAEGRGCARDDLLFAAGAPQFQKKMADLVRGTAWSRHRWHCFRRGGAAACWKRGPALPHSKWWGRWAATATAMAYALGYRDEEVVAPLCLPQVWGSVSAAAFADPQQVWGNIMFDERHQDKNRPVWGRSERRRAAPGMFRGKTFAGEPRSDAADLGSSSEDTGSGVSADDGPSARSGIRRIAEIVPAPEARRSSRAGPTLGKPDIAGRGPTGLAGSLPSGGSDTSDAAGPGERSPRHGGERTKFRFTAPPSGRPKAPPNSGPWRSAAEPARGHRGVKRTVGGRALSVPAGQQSGEAVAVAPSSTRCPVATRVARAGRRPRHSDGKSGPGRKRSKTLPSGTGRTGGGGSPTRMTSPWSQP